MALETSATLCERFGVTRSAVNYWVLRGWLTPLIRNRRFHLFDGVEVERFQHEVWEKLRPAGGVKARDRARGRRG